MAEQGSPAAADGGPVWGYCGPAGRRVSRHMNLLLVRFSVVLTLLFLGPCPFYLVTTSFRASLHGKPSSETRGGFPIHERENSCLCKFCLTEAYSIHTIDNEEMLFSQPTCTPAPKRCFCEDTGAFCNPLNTGLADTASFCCSVTAPEVLNVTNAAPFCLTADIFEIITHLLSISEEKPKNLRSEMQVSGELLPWPL